MELYKTLDDFLYLLIIRFPFENPTRTKEFQWANGCCHDWMVRVQ